MQGATIIRWTPRRTWRAMGPGRRIGLSLLVMALSSFGAWRAYEWWTGWPSRIVLPGPEWRLPMAFSPDGSVLATRSTTASQEIALWDARTGRRGATWPAPEGRFRFRGAFSPDGRTLASPWHLRANGRNFSVNLIDVATGRVRSTIGSPRDGFLGLAFRDGGATIRLVAFDSTGIEMLDAEVATGRVVADRRPSCPTAPSLHALSDDGRLLALIPHLAAPGPLTAAIWDLDADREVLSLPLGSRVIYFAIAFSPDERSLAIGMEDGSIQVWDLAARRLRSTFRAHRPNYSPMQLAFSPDGSTLASFGHFSHHALSIDLAQEYLARALGGPDRAMQYEMVVLDARTGRALARSREDGIAVFSPDGRSVATSHEDGGVRIHDLPAQAEAR